MLIAENGALWVGTDNGLVRKYNTTIDSYFTEDGLPLNNIWALTEDKHGKLWIGTYGEGISHFDGTHFTTISKTEGLIHNEITHLFLFQDSLYVGTSDGISIVSVADKKVVAAATTSGDKPMRISGFFEFQNIVYATTYDTGIFALSRKRDSLNLIKVSDHSYIYAAYKKGDSLYASNKKHIAILSIHDLINEKKASTRIIKNQSIVWDYEENYKGELYGGAWGVFEEDGGLIKFNDDISLSKRITEISSSEVINLAYDNDLKQLFVGTKDAGVFRIFVDPIVKFVPSLHSKMVDITHFKDICVQLFDHGLKIEDTFINAAFFKKQEVAYVTTHINKLPKYEDFFYELEYNTPADQILFYGIKTSKEFIWVNTSIGLYKFRQSGKFDSYLPLHTLAFDFGPSDELIETNPYHGLRVYQDEKELKYSYYDTNNPTTPTDIVSTVVVGGTTYFLSVFKGLFSYDGAFTSFVDSKVWDEEKLRHSTPYGKGLAISNEAGDVFVIDETSGDFEIVEKISRKEIRGNALLFLDHYKEWLIIATEKGITFYNGEKQIFINEEQGILHPVYASSVQNDMLFLASDNGNYEVDLKKLLTTLDKIDTVFISKITVNDGVQSIPETSLRLGSQENNVAIHIETNAHPYPEKLTYAYRIKEDATWKEMSNQIIDLRFLEPGKYNIQVRVKDASTGQFVETTLLSLTIAAPFYQRWWFLLLTAIFFVAVVYFILDSRRKKQAVRDAIEVATSKHIEELKTEALLAQMNPHFIFNALNSIQHLVVINENERASKYLTKFSKLVRANLNNAQRPFTSLQEELDYLRTYCEIENERHGNRVIVKFNVAPQINTSEIEIPTLILQPFLENAFVHAFPRTIETPLLEVIIVPHESRQIRYEIKDNGIGSQSLLTKSLTTSKGISLIKDRLHFLNYDVSKCLTVDYTESGTFITLLL